MDLKIIFQYSVVFTDFLEASLESFLLHVLGGIAAPRLGVGEVLPLTGFLGWIC